MSQLVKSSCEKCGASLTVKRELLGKRGRCPACEQPTSLNESVGDLSPSVDQTSVAQALVDTLAGTSAQSTVDNVPLTHDAKQTKKITKLGRFEIRELLGAGAFGRVYKAYDPQLERFVALKLPIFAATDQQRARRFIAEAKHAARLSHPNIVQVFESGQVGDKSFIATQFVEGETLAARISWQQLTARESVELVVQLADALAYAHQNGIIHRDIKPENIMLDDSARPLIMDFGLAKRLDDNANMTRDGALLGTPAYMSPEQARGEIELLGPASDQYSLGVVLYRLLAGTTPFAGPVHVVIANVAISPAPSLSQCGKFVPWELAAICDKTLQHSALDRYADCSALKADLSRWLVGQPISIKSSGRRHTFGHVAKWLQGRPAQIALGLLGSMFLASIIIFFKGNRVEVADGANVSIKLDGENLVVQPITPAIVAETPSTPSTDATTPSSNGSTAEAKFGDNILPSVAVPKKWHIYQHPDSVDKASVSYEAKAVCIDIQQIVGNDFFTQLSSPSLEIDEGGTYRFSITARSPNRSRIVCNADRGGNPDYGLIGLDAHLTLTDQFQTFQQTFVATQVGDQKDRICLNCNLDVGKIYISNVELRKSDAAAIKTEGPQPLSNDLDKGSVGASSDAVAGGKLAPQTVAPSLPASTAGQPQASEPSSPPEPATPSGLDRAFMPTKVSIGDTPTWKELQRKPEALRVILAKLQRDLQELSRYKSGYLIIGRIRVDGVRGVPANAQMIIEPNGFFCDAIKNLTLPIGFRRIGYRALDVVIPEDAAVDENGVIDLGTLTMEKSPGNEIHKAVGTIALEGQARPSSVSSSLYLSNGPVNTPQNGTEGINGDSYQGEIFGKVGPTGQVVFTGLTEGQYYATFEAPGFVALNQSIEVLRDQDYDLGNIELEIPRRISVEYVVGSGAEPRLSLESVKTGVYEGNHEWKLGPEYGWDLKFIQKNGEIQFSAFYVPCSIVDLGEGSVRDFIDVGLDHSFKEPSKVPVNSGHVYLLNQGHWKRYVLFRVEVLEPTAVPKRAARKR